MHFAYMRFKSLLKRDRNSVAGGSQVLIPTTSTSIKTEMAAVPMGAFAAFKTREFMDHNNSREDSTKSESQGKSMPNMNTNNIVVGTDLQESPPVKYNGKLMNSIWGMYNRYSVHNLKASIAYEKL